LLVERRRALDEQIAATARAYYAEGHSWTEIGKALGITRQSARERFGRDES
jgi:DNA invertase Pin-like site-specific DNA recombinase